MRHFMEFVNPFCGIWIQKSHIDFNTKLAMRASEFKCKSISIYTSKVLVFVRMNMQMNVAF